MVTMLTRFLTFMETCEPEVLFTEEELAELLKDAVPSGVSVNSEVSCHGNQLCDNRLHDAVTGVFLRGKVP